MRTDSIPFLDSLTDLGLSRLGINDPTLSAERVAENAIREGVAGFFFRDARYAKDRLPSVVAELLSGVVFDHAALLAASRHKFAAVLAKCVEDGIPVLLLKGIALGEFVYLCNWCRPMSDIDILVQYSDIPKLIEIMQATRMVPVRQCDAAPAEREEHHIVWTADSHSWQFILECHWNIVPPYSPFPVRTSALWEHAQPCTYARLPVKVLCPEHFLIHLCVNWHYNTYPVRLRDLFDIYAMVAGSQPLRWDMLVDISRAWNADSVVCLAVEEMMQLFKVDDEFHSRAASMVPKGCLQRTIVTPVLRKMVGREQGLEKAPFVQSILLALSGRSLRTLNGWLFPSRDRLMFKYGNTPKEKYCRYLVLYYLDILRRMVSVLINAVHGAKNS